MAGIDFVAVLVAAVASFAFGSVYYMSLSKPWVAATGKGEAELKAAMGPATFAITFVAQIVMAAGLAAVVGYAGAATVGNGLLSGALIWFCFVMTTMLINHSYQGASRNLTAIDGGHWLGVLLVQGLVIGLFGA